MKGLEKLPQPQPHPGGTLTNAASVPSPMHTLLPGHVITAKIVLSRVENGLGPLSVAVAKMCQKGNGKALIYLGKLDVMAETQVL